MNWNHRVIITIDGDGITPIFGIHECFYDSKNDMVPHSWTENAIPAYGDSIEGLKTTLDRMKAACDKPILIENDGKLQECQQ